MQQSKQVLEWQAEARKEGELKGKAEAVLRVLQSRTGRTIPVALANVIRNTTDTDILDQWIDVATSVNSLKEFRRRINS